MLLERGWKSVHPLYGGFDAWVRAGMPVEKKESGENQPSENQ
jgi:3-mercaptopyruvate sulfurtransferase SseA